MIAIRNGTRRASHPNCCVVSPGRAPVYSIAGACGSAAFASTPHARTVDPAVHVHLSGCRSLLLLSVRLLQTLARMLSFHATPRRRRGLAVCCSLTLCQILVRLAEQAFGDNGRERDSRREADGRRSLVDGVRETD